MAQHGRLPLLCLLLCFVSAALERHECDRLCLSDERPKKCFYNFTIGVSQTKHEAQRSLFLSVNGKRPGPMISVCQNDTVVIDVKNQLPLGLETSFHWHGLSEGNSPFMDGVPMITQCPIFTGTRFRYIIKANKPGTFYYRAHSVAQQLDGIYGPLIVHEGKDQVFPEKSIIIAPLMKDLQVLESSYELNLSVTHLLLKVFNDSIRNGKENENMAQRLRIINAAALDCPVTIFTHIVPLKVVAVDGNNVKPRGLNEIVINPGERIDLLVKPEVMKVTHLVGHNLCKGHTKYGFEPGASEKNYDELKLKDSALYFDKVIDKLEPEKSEELSQSDITIYLPFDVSVFKRFSGPVDFRYKLGALSPYAPSVLTKNTASVFQVYNKSFLYPSSPLLSQPEDISEDIICDLDEPSSRCLLYNNGFCECLNIINLPYNKEVDLVLINEGKNGNSSQTFHIHGYSFFVLSMGSFENAITVKDVEEKEGLGFIKRNLVNPIKKDTITVPNKGYVILRLRTSHPGKWLIESTTSKAKEGSGLELILNVDNVDNNQVPPKGFPSCGSMKPPDLVFNSD